jgi:hypothetical protein
MKRIWNTEAELRDVLRRLEPWVLDASKAFASRYSADPKADHVAILTESIEIGAWIAGDRAPLAVLRWPQEARQRVAVCGIAISQWFAEVEAGRARDVELARMLETKAIESARREIHAAASRASGQSR